MEVILTRTIEDPKRFVSFQIRQSKRPNYTFWLWLIGGSAVPLGIAIYKVPDDEGSIWDAVRYLAWAVGWLITYPFLYRSELKWGINKHVKDHCTNDHIGELRLLITDDSLVEISPTKRIEAAWKDVFGIVENGDTTYIYTTPETAAILPSHGFSSVQEYESVRNYCKDCFDRSRQ